MLDVGTDEARERYSEAKLEAKRVVWKAKNEEWAQLGRELEKEAVNKQRKFWRRVNQHRRSKGGGVHINGEDGQLLTDQTEVMDQWKEHFESLFQEDDGGSEQPDLELSQENDKKISEEEVRRAVSRLKGGKAPGTCGIMSEMLKAGGEVAIEWLVNLFNVVWERGVAPRDWKTAIIVPFHKKGSRLECTNYRGITLLSVVGKVFARVLNDRVKGLTEGSVMDEQGGFRSARGCIDQVFAVKQVIEKMIEKGRVMFMVFIDLEKAYDNVCREKLWRVLSGYGVRGRLLRSIKALYEGGRARVKVEGMESQGFRVRKGVRQGCTLSPWLFNVFIDKVVKEARRECVREVTLSTGLIGILMFADDMVMMAETKEALQHNVEAMNEALSRWDLRVNWKKSKVMRVARKREECQVVIGDEQLEQVDTMKYLGVMISGDGSMELEVEARIGCACRVIGRMSQAILRRRELSKQTKLKVVNATVMPVLMYGCETWAVRKEQKSKIQATQMNILWRIEGVCWKDRITNDEILQRLGQVGVLDMVRKRQEEWKGRLEGMDNERCTKRAFEGVVEGRRPREEKKGSKKLCKNYRGISLLSIPGKVFAKILDARIRQVTESQVMEEQAGFRVGRGCRDQIFVMRQLAEKTIEKDGKMYAAFIDLERAYDKVWREDMWRTLAMYGVSGRLLRAVKALYENSKARVRVEDELTECFDMRQGVRQGCPLSPWLFNVFLDMVAWEARAQFKGGVCLDNCTLQLLMFADDTVLLAETEEDLQQNVREFSEAVKRHRLAMNTEKTTTMVFSRKKVDCNVEVDGQKLENVMEQTYLGVILSEDGRMECELEKRIGAALSAAGAVRSQVLESRDLSKSAKMLVYKTMIEPTLTYGAESWVLKEREKQRVQAAEMRVLRKIAGVRRIDHVRNEDIRAQLRQEGVVEQVGRERFGRSR